MKIHTWMMNKKLSRRRRPLPFAVSMAADDEHIGVVPVDGLADDAPRVALHRLVADVVHLRFAAGRGRDHYTIGDSLGERIES